MSKRILVVENYSDLLMVIAATLRHRRYECVSVTDPSEAVQKLRNETFASILLDVTWPVASSPVLSFLHGQKKEEMKKVIIMTGFDPHYLRLEHLSDVCTFLRKPFGIDELIERLQHCTPEGER